MTLNYTTDVEVYRFKIAIIGDSGVGKSAISQRFVHDGFSTEYVATIGVDYQTRTLDIDAKRYKIEIWDTAGQDRFKCIIRSIYRNANGVIICFDITDMESFRSVNSWLQQVEECCPEETHIILVGTKSDLKAQRMVSYDMIQSFAKEKQLSYFEMSSKTNENVETCFVDLTRTLVTRTDQMIIKHKRGLVKVLQFCDLGGSGRSGGNKCTI